MTTKGDDMAEQSSRAKYPWETPGHPQHPDTPKRPPSFRRWMFHHPIQFICLCFAGLIALTFAVEWYSASQRATVYRRLTGKPMTTWEAMWVDIQLNTLSGEVRLDD